MYKTVRHGENSLQYTILPQTEEVLTNSGIKGKGRDYSPSIHIRRRKRSTAKYVLLIAFGIMITTMLVAIPICLMNGALYVRRHHGTLDSIASPPLTPTGRELVKSRKKELKMPPALIMEEKIETSPTSETSTATLTIKQILNEKSTNTPWSMPALRSWKNAASSPTPTPELLVDNNNNNNMYIGTPSGTIRLLDRYMSLKPWEKEMIANLTSTAIAEPVTKPKVKPTIRSLISMMRATRPTSTAATTTPPTTTATSTPMVSTSSSSNFADLKDALLSVDDDDDFKESLEVDEVFPLPPLKPEWRNVEVTVSQVEQPWPYFDTAYFQWTGSSRQLVFAFAVAMSAVTSAITIVILMLCCRNRRAKQMEGTNSQVNLTVEQDEDDNTNLLVESNSEESSD